MSTLQNRSLTFFSAVQRGVRAAAGKALGPALRRWRNTCSGEEGLGEPDAETARFLIRYGALDAGDEGESRRRTYAELLRSGARATGEAPGVLAAWLHAFAAGEHGWTGGAVCGAEPRCGACALCETCRFLTAGAREDRLSSAALAEVLAAPENGEAVSPGGAELLALLLFGPAKGAGAVACAEGLLKAHAGLRGLLAADKAELRKLHLDAEARSRLRALGELARLWSREEEPRGKLFSSAQDIYDYHYLRLRDLKKECFFVLCLDQKNRLLGEEEVSVGSLTEALVHPREALLPAIRLQAAAVAIMHNHPSGDPAPSRADKALTRRLRDAAELVGLRLVDHVVVGDGVYYSFAENGLM